MKRKKISLRIKAILLVSLIMLAANLALGGILMSQSSRSAKKHINERMLDIANTAAAMLDGDVIGRLRAEDEGTPEYEEVYNTLARFRDNANLEYIYYVRDMKNGTFTFGIDTDPDAPAAFGDPVVKTPALKNASRGFPDVDDRPYEDEWGEFYSAFCPVFDSTGKMTGIVAVDFKASWFDEQMRSGQRTTILIIIGSMAICIALTVFLTGQFRGELKEVRTTVGELSDDLDSLTAEFSGEKSAEPPVREDERGEGTRALARRVSGLRDDLRQYMTHANTQANSMITAMASDYRAVYLVDLDGNDGVCFRSDPNDTEQTPMGVHFNYTERFAWYAEHCVAESYREGFLRFIDPESIRAALADQSLIAYRYLAQRAGREYYEMIRMAGVRRVEDRDDHTVHSIGLGLTVIDQEMRETMAKNEALAEALAAAEEASKAKTSFLSSMSHEIRTPMNAIIGLDTLALKDPTLSDQTRDYLEKIGGSAHHLLALINDILDMSRIESGRMVLRKTDFSFSGMLEQINTMVMSQCSDKGLTYECRILSRVDDAYIGDDMKLKEVLINILSNAIKFTDAPGSVTLTVERTAEFEDQSTLRFCIRDTGIGMDKEFIPKIFEAFSQEDSSRKNKYGSTGLGMAITKRIVEMMNGTISVESEKGAGTEFAVTVTLRNCDKKLDEREDSIDPHTMHVLVVDDDAIAAEHARMVLDEAGISADVCLSGAEALRMMEVQRTKQQPYNLVLMDWNMPEMNGLETSEKIRQEFSNDTTVVVLTAYNWDDIQEEAHRVGVDSFLSKPLFASNVIDEFERIARKNLMGLFKEKKRAELAGRTVLLAEDVEINAEIMIDILSTFDVEADHAENGRVAVDMFEKSEPGRYSAILMDVRMPEMDGLEATETIRALPREDAKRIPIIAMTANAFDEDVQRSLQAGMNAHLSKPVDTDHMIKVLGELIYEAENPS